MKIVIFGLAKSGTTALFYKIRSSLPAGSIALFEPTSYGTRDRLRERIRAMCHGHFAPHVLAKVLPWDAKPTRVEHFDGFDRRVILVRDPRDRLVSHLLYRSFNAAFARDCTAAGAFLALLRRKEADPRSVPMMHLLRAFDQLERDAGAPTCWRERYEACGVMKPLLFHDRRPSLPVFRYEQLVDGQFGPLEDILGCDLGGTATVPPALHRVVRTRSYGTWRDWFTPEDVDTLRPVLAPYLERYYPSAEWDLGSAPTIAPEYSSIYVERVINERRGLTGLPPLPPAA